MEVERIKPYIGVSTAVALLLFVAFAGPMHVESPVPAPTVSTSTTLAAIPSVTSSVFLTPSVKRVVGTVATSSPVTTPAAPKKITLPTPNKAPATIVGAASAATPVATASTSHSDESVLDAPSTALRSALVNIICYAPANGPLRSISGSGVFVDPKGVIITNAHVAQYFLLADQGVSCVIRMGSPAVDTYRASLMYISPKWVYANADLLTKSNPLGTGQYDFAFLAVSARATLSALPSAFPFVPLATESPSIGTPVTIASYGAQYLPPSQIRSGLFPTIVSDSIRDVFTYKVDSVDIVELGDSAAAQEGSSGGGVVDHQGSLIGLLTTSAENGATGTHILDAITSSYIRFEYGDETGQSLDSLFTQPPLVTAAGFSSRMPALEALITSHL